MAASDPPSQSPTTFVQRHGGLWDESTLDSVRASSEESRLSRVRLLRSRFDDPTAISDQAAADLLLYLAFPVDSNALSEGLRRRAIAADLLQTAVVEGDLSAGTLAAPDALPVEVLIDVLDAERVRDLGTAGEMGDERRQQVTALRQTLAILEHAARHQPAAVAARLDPILALVAASPDLTEDCLAILATLLAAAPEHLEPAIPTLRRLVADDAAGATAAGVLLAALAREYPDDVAPAAPGLGRLLAARLRSGSSEDGHLASLTSLSIGDGERPARILLNGLQWCAANDPNSITQAVDQLVAALETGPDGVDRSLLVELLETVADSSPSALVPHVDTLVDVVVSDLDRDQSEADARLVTVLGTVSDATDATVDPKSVGEFAEYLESGSDPVRESVLDTLQQVSDEDPAAITPYLADLRDLITADDPRTQSRAITTVANVMLSRPAAGDQLITALETTLDQDDPDVRRGAATALARMLDANDAAIAKRAARAIANAACSDATAAVGIAARLVDALAGATEETRRHLLHALYHVSHEAPERLTPAAESIAEYRSVNEPRVYSILANLAEASPDAVRPLVDLFHDALDDGQVPTRVQATRALYYLDRTARLRQYDHWSVTSVLRSLSHEDEAVRTSMGRALREGVAGLDATQIVQLLGMEQREIPMLLVNHYPQVMAAEPISEWDETLEQFRRVGRGDVDSVDCATTTEPDLDEAQFHAASGLLMGAVLNPRIAAVSDRVWTTCRATDSFDSRFLGAAGEALSTRENPIIAAGVVGSASLCAPANDDHYRRVVDALEAYEAGTDVSALITDRLLPLLEVIDAADREPLLAMIVHLCRHLDATDRRTVGRALVDASGALESGTAAGETDGLDTVSGFKTGLLAATEVHVLEDEQQFIGRLTDTLQSSEHVTRLAGLGLVSLLWRTGEGLHSGLQEAVYEALDDRFPTVQATALEAIAMAEPTPDLVETPPVDDPKLRRLLDHPVDHVQRQVATLLLSGPIATAESTASRLLSTAGPVATVRLLPRILDQATTAATAVKRRLDSHDPAAATVDLADLQATLDEWYASSEGSLAIAADLALASAIEREHREEVATGLADMARELAREADADPTVIDTLSDAAADSGKVAARFITQFVSDDERTYPPPTPDPSRPIHHAFQYGISIALDERPVETVRRVAGTDAAGPFLLSLWRLLQRGPYPYRSLDAGGVLAASRRLDEVDPVLDAGLVAILAPLGDASALPGTMPGPAASEQSVQGLVRFLEGRLYATVGSETETLDAIQASSAAVAIADRDPSVAVRVVCNFDAVTHPRHDIVGRNLLRLAATALAAEKRQVVESAGGQQLFGMALTLLRNGSPGMQNLAGIVVGQFASEETNTPELLDTLRLALPDPDARPVPGVVYGITEAVETAPSLAERVVDDLLEFGRALDRIAYFEAKPIGKTTPHRRPPLITVLDALVSIASTIPEAVAVRMSPDDITHLLRVGNAEVSLRLARLLACLGPVSRTLCTATYGLDILAAWATDADARPDLRGYAAHALGEIASVHPDLVAPVADRLVIALDDDNPLVATAAGTALAAVTADSGPHDRPALQRAGPRLREALVSDYSQFRHAAASALAALGSDAPEAVAPTPAAFGQLLAGLAAGPAPDPDPDGDPFKFPEPETITPNLPGQAVSHDTIRSTLGTAIETAVDHRPAVVEPHLPTVLGMLRQEPPLQTVAVEVLATVADRQPGLLTPVRGLLRDVLQDGFRGHPDRAVLRCRLATVVTSLSPPIDPPLVGDT